MNKDQGTQSRNVPGWQLEAGALSREFKFPDFARAFGFMSAVAIVAEKLGHHPDWSNSYNRVTVRLTTHDAGGVTTKDYELAEAMNRMAGE